MLYISQMDARAAELARGRGLGLELIEFCAPERMEDEAALVHWSGEFVNFAAASLHAPFAELFPCAVDREVRAVAQRRLLRAGEVCARLGVRRMIAHSGCAPRLYFPEWYVPQSVEFWRELLRELPEGVELLLENVLDPEPGELAAIVDGVDDPRLGICLDIGHANVYSPRPVSEWISTLGARIRHVHLHNNDGTRDAHAPLSEGSLDIPPLLAMLREYAAAADWCIESRDAEACLRELERLGYAAGDSRTTGAGKAHSASFMPENASPNHAETAAEGGTHCEAIASECRAKNRDDASRTGANSSGLERYGLATVNSRANRTEKSHSASSTPENAGPNRAETVTEGGTYSEAIAPECCVANRDDASSVGANAVGGASSPGGDISLPPYEEGACAELSGVSKSQEKQPACGNGSEDRGTCSAPYDPLSIHIPAPDKAAMAAAEARQRMLAKPPGSLGVLEEISIRFAGMTGRERNRARRRRLLVFAADNGVTAEGVSSAPKSVTLAQTLNLARGMTGAATLARHFDTELRVYDVGVDAPGPLGGGVAHRRIANGTRNLAVESAMTRGEVLAALRVGIDAAAEAADAGVEIIGVGEMGIGNTTTSAAVLSALLNLPADVTVGRGGGVNDAGFVRKREIVDAAVARLKGAQDVLDVLAEVGGLDIAAMCGAFIGAAERRLPTVIDGYISVVAALCAERLAPGCRNFMFASHASWERGYARAVEALGLKPMLALEMRLGEGSGCPLAFAVIDAALMVHDEMATFEQARIDDGYLAEIRGDARLQR